MMKTTIYLLVLVSLFLLACNNDKKQESTNNMNMGNTNMSMGKNHNHSTDSHSSREIDDSNAGTIVKKSDLSAKIIDGYLKLKNALVEDNSQKAAEAGKLILNAFDNFDMSKLTNKQHKEYMEIAEDSKEQLEHIIKNPIDHQREHFEVLSNDLYDLIVLIGTNKHLYLDSCNMFNEGRKSIWLSEEKEIKNPYFGSKNLSCGNIQKEFK